MSGDELYMLDYATKRRWRPTFSLRGQCRAVWGWLACLASFGICTGGVSMMFGPRSDGLTVAAVLIVGAALWIAGVVMLFRQFSRGERRGIITWLLILAVVAQVYALGAAWAIFQFVYSKTPMRLV
jgi:hypothetical protein